MTISSGTLFRQATAVLRADPKPVERLGSMSPNFGRLRPPPTTAQFSGTVGLGALDTPGTREVQLRLREGVVLERMWSDATTGAFASRGWYPPRDDYELHVIGGGYVSESFPVTTPAQVQWNGNPLIADSGTLTSGSVTPDAMYFTKTTLLEAVTGTPYRDGLMLVGAVGAVTWSASGLPAGLSIANPSQADITGSSTGTAGFYSVTITATDSAPTPRTISITVTLSLVEASLIYYYAGGKLRTSDMAASAFSAEISVGGASSVASNFYRLGSTILAGLYSGSAQIASYDAGATWNVVAGGGSISGGGGDTILSNGKFIRCGGVNNVATSLTGAASSFTNIASASRANAICRLNTGRIVVTSIYNATALYSDDNAVTFNAGTDQFALDTSPTNYMKLATDGNTLVSFAQKNTAYMLGLTYSLNGGVNWTSAFTGFPNNPADPSTYSVSDLVCCPLSSGGNLWMAVTNTGHIATSTNGGFSWALSPTVLTAANPTGIAQGIRLVAGQGKIIVQGQDGYLTETTDGVAFTAVSANPYAGNTARDAFGVSRIINAPQYDVLRGYVVALLKTQGADNSTTFRDECYHTFTAAGDTKINGNMALFDGTGDWIASADHADWEPGANNWCVEGFATIASTGRQGIFSKGAPGDWQTFDLSTDGTGSRALEFSCSNGIAWVTANTAANVYTVGTKFHWALYRLGGTVYLAVDGVVKASAAIAVTLVNNTAELRVGYGGRYSAPAANGTKIGPFRYTNGHARYSGSGFTPPVPADFV